MNCKVCRWIDCALGAVMIYAPSSKNSTDVVCPILALRPIFILCMYFERALLDEPKKKNF